MIHPGDMFEMAIWLNGEETPENVKRWKEETCKNAVSDAEAEHNVIIGPVSFLIKRPGEDRVPQVPDHIKGIDVRLLVAQATVFAFKPTLNDGPGFIHDVEPNDLAVLRKATREAHSKRYPGQRLNNKQCDQIINSLGPEVALKTLYGSTTH